MKEDCVLAEFFFGKKVVLLAYMLVRCVVWVDEAGMNKRSEDIKG
jgi:hypothetical protein